MSSYVVHDADNEIKFNKEFYPLIRDGIKTQTLRLARKRLDVTEGDIVTAVFPGIVETLKIKILITGKWNTGMLKKEQR